MFHGRNLSKLLLLPTLLSLTTSCTIYRSDGRNKFESEAPAKVANQNFVGAHSSFQLIQCQKETHLQTWLQEEFPKQNYTLVISDNDLEIWSLQKEETFEVRVRQKNEEATQSCTYEFADEKTWNHFQEQFIFEMRNNLIINE